MESERKVQSLTRRTKEVDISGTVITNKKSGKCNILLSATGDFTHHLAEELLYLLAEELDLRGHLGVVINKLKVRLDLAKEIK